MKDLLNDIELAERFLAGKLTDGELKNLADRHDNENDFNTLLQDMDRLIEGIKSSGNKTSIEEKINALKQYASKGEQEEEEILLKKEGKTVLFNNYNKKIIYSIAASMLILIVALFGINYFKAADSAPELYAKYFEPFDSPGSGLTRSTDGKVEIKASAYEAYDAGNYTVATELFEKALLEKDEAIIHLCLANAYMKQNDFEKAENNLTHLLKAHTDLVTQTKWYLALVYLKENKLERAKATLWEISKSSTYGEKAKALLDELD